jgi:hypothetical protein
MLEVVTDAPADVLAIRATGKVTADDYRSVLIPALDRALERGAKIRLVYELGKDYEGFEAGGVWQDLRLGAAHFASFERIALVTDTEWLHDGARLFSALMPGEVRVFGTSERDAAASWAAEES